MSCCSSSCRPPADRKRRILGELHPGCSVYLPVLHIGLLKQEYAVRHLPQPFLIQLRKACYPNEISRERSLADVVMHVDRRWSIKLFFGYHRALDFLVIKNVSCLPCRFHLRLFRVAVPGKLGPEALTIILRFLCVHPPKPSVSLLPLLQLLLCDPGVIQLVSPPYTSWGACSAPF